MTTLAFSYVAYNRRRFIWPGILMAVVLSLMSAEAWAATCRFNDPAGPQDLVLPTPTIEVPDAGTPTLLWRSVPRVQLSCTAGPDESNNQKLYLFLFPNRGGWGHWSAYGVNATAVLAYGNREAVTGEYIDTGHTINRGETKVFSVEYTLSIWSGGWGNESASLQIPNYPMVAMLAGHGWVRETAYHTINVNFIRRPARTCALSMADRNRTVRLPVIGANRLSTETPTGGRVNFDLRLSDCSAAVNRADFTFSGRAAPGSTDYFANRGTASGVALHLGMRDGGQTIAPQGPRNVASVVVTGRRGTLPLFAQYYRTAEVAAGTFNTTAEFTLSYQ